MAPKILLFAAFAALGSCAPAPLEARAGTLPPKSDTKLLGRTKPTLPNIYRDGGGGGKINGLNVMMFSDGLYTKDGQPPAADNSNVVNFTSNSISVFGNSNGQDLLNLQEFGTQEKGPLQQIPYFYHEGEDDHKTGIWPNQGIVTLCGGICGVSFPQVINRTAISVKAQGALYNTGVQIDFTGYGPVAGRPVKALFNYGEPAFGTFSAMTGTGTDKNLYTFASIDELANGANGLKLARVAQDSWSDRSKYEFWNGQDFVKDMPKFDDGGVANVFNWTQGALDGKQHGPGSGDIFYSNYYGVYMMLFQASNAATDDNVYLSYSKSLTGGWSKPTNITQVTRLEGGYTYGFHAYPHVDETQKTLPLSWSAFAPPNNYQIIMAEVTFQ